MIGEASADLVRAVLAPAAIARELRSARARLGWVMRRLRHAERLLRECVCDAA